MPLIQDIQGSPLTPDQSRYLDGFFAGLQAKGMTFGDAQTQAQAAAPEKVLIAEERIKKEEHPLDSYYRLVENARHNTAPDKEELFRFKWNGLFFLSPVKDAFMARLRIPGGQLKTFQLREIARTAKEITTGYVQITTRANLQIRLIQPKDAPEFLQRIQSVGLHTRGSGADNIRNLTANPTAGIDPHELIDVLPFCHELGQFILSQREFYDLPRKFNVAFDGGGLIGSVEDTNDVGARAVLVGANDSGIEPGVYFRIALGGATGHKAFARDLGVLVPPAEIVRVIVAVIRVYIANGNREDRKKARLKHLLEKWTLEQYLGETEKLLGRRLPRIPPSSGGTLSVQETAALPEVPHSHVGVFPQKQKGLSYVGVALPVGQITPKQLLQVADLADSYGTGEIRLTVWQNFIIPNVPDAFVPALRKSLKRIGLGTEQSNLATGFVACTGNKYCKFSSTDTKGHAQELVRYLEKHVRLDQPVNVHLTGCPHSCAQHYMGDIGLLGTKVKSGEGYHVFVGGGFGRKQAVGRQVFQGIAFEELKGTLEKMLKGYLRHRDGKESFQEFSNRHDLNSLQAIFSNEE